MYSQELVDLARVLDRLTVGLYHARNQLEDAVSLGLKEMTETYLSAMESTIPVLERQFIEMLVAESRPYGVVEVVDSKILVPDWVEAKFDGYIDGDEFGWSRDDIVRAHAEGYKVLFEPSGMHGYEVNRLDSSVPDSLIEVWWSRADIHVGCGRHNDICGFLTKIDGMGWHVFFTEQ